MMLEQRYKDMLPTVIVFIDATTVGPGTVTFYDFWRGTQFQWYRIL